MQCAEHAGNCHYLIVAMRLLWLLFLCLVFGCSSGFSLAELPEDLRASVLEVRAYHADRPTVFGSAVVVGPGKLVTNSHVTHSAIRIEVAANGRVWPVTLTAHDVVRDLCLLDAPGLDAPKPIWSNGIEPGAHVYAAGFVADHRLVVTNGQVTALHDYEGAQVIQASAPFDYGSSGGGLFDAEGRLIGILTFKARVGGPFHFAVPVAWIARHRTTEEMGRASTAVAFWQYEREALPYFLRAVALEASGNWTALATLANEWIKTEPTNQGAWRTLAKVQSYAQNRAR
jgi:serine protease Do